MVDDLINRRLLIGKTRKQVVDLLGRPGSPVTASKGYLTYSLGRERSPFPID